MTILLGPKKSQALIPVHDLLKGGVIVLGLPVLSFNFDRCTVRNLFTG